MIKMSYLNYVPLICIVAPVRSLHPSSQMQQSKAFSRVWLGFLCTVTRACSVTVNFPGEGVILFSHC